MADFEEFSGGLPEGHELLWLMRAVGRIDGKLDGFLDKMQMQDRRLTDFEERLRKTEGHQYKVAGASGVIALFAGAVMSFASHLIKG
jgi:hypothetical protein